MHRALHTSDLINGALTRPLPGTGIRQMEEQHDRLLQFFGELREAMAAGEGYIQLRRILGELMVYTLEQFHDEEELMADSGFTGTLEHIRDHQAILIELNQMIAGYDMGSAVFAADLANVLHRWISNHVAKHDMTFAEFLMANGAV